ncbi:hypothetical protein [Phytohabitans suffuscus]|uniref:Uncharacterized protein n=1 Tax=Phytohabitans suffuscus TaxID=624315 RepID=A0A6F8YQV6_9ACTN|nr:hypothetical protein [Phytohabitans suffuscus]BCB88298.1 hypothetical protein Psuf_056110 [Phytohabitans suffuscus]
MMMHPDLVLAQANERQRELIAEADRERLLATARLARRARRARQEAPARGQPVAAHAR